MSTAEQHKAGPSGVRYRGKTYRPGQILPRHYRRERPDDTPPIDPASRIPHAAPGFGEPTIPHITTFQSLISSASKTYRNPDQAIRQSRENAIIMRNDCAIMECLEARQRRTALLNWHIEPDDPKSLDQKDLADKVTKALTETPRFTEYRRVLLEALWFGRYGVENIFGFDYRLGRRRTVIKKWLPRHGDKLVFRFDDGEHKYRDDEVGIRVMTMGLKGDDVLGRYKVEPTDQGLAYFLEPWERSRLVIHRHMIEDAAYEDPMSAGSIHGVGIRSRIYWTWFQKQETLAMLMEYMERTSQGLWVYRYPAGNPQALAEVRKIAEQQTVSNVILMPASPGDPAMDAYAIERVEPNAAGSEVLMRIGKEYFGELIKRYILGQTLTSEAQATGMGSGVSEAHRETLDDIVEYDAQNLEETLTTDLVEVVKNFNHPDARNIKLRFKIDTESSGADKQLDAAERAWNIGLKIKSADIYDMIGLSKPAEDDEVLQNPQMQQQQRLWEQAHAPGAQEQGFNPATHGPGGEQPEEGSVEDLFGPLAKLHGLTDGGDGGQENDQQPPDNEQPAKFQRSMYRAPDGANMPVPVEHRVGETKNFGGHTYRLNEHHRWERQDKDQQPPDGDAGGDMPQPTDQPKPQPGGPQAAQQPAGNGQSQPPQAEQGPSREDRHQFATQQLGSIDKNIGGLFKAFQSSPEFKQSGEYYSKDIAPEQAQAAYGFLKQNVGQDAGGGKVVDLGQGRLGFSSPAGAMVMEPPKGDGAPWKTTYTVMTGPVGRAMGFNGQQQSPTDVANRAAAEGQQPWNSGQPDDSSPDDPNGPLPGAGAALSMPANGGQGKPPTAPNSPAPTDEPPPAPPSLVARAEPPKANDKPQQPPAAPVNPESPPESPPLVARATPAPPQPRPKSAAAKLPAPGTIDKKTGLPIYYDIDRSGQSGAQSTATPSAAEQEQSGNLEQMFSGMAGAVSQNLRKAFRDSAAKGTVPSAEKNSTAGRVAQEAIKRGYTSPKDIDRALDFASSLPETRGPEFFDALNKGFNAQFPKGKAGEQSQSAPNKPPHEMTREEFSAHFPAARHKAEIKKAIAEGKEIPANVLADYPELGGDAQLQTKSPQTADQAPKAPAPIAEKPPKPTPEQRQAKLKSNVDRYLHAHGFQKHPEAVKAIHDAIDKGIVKDHKDLLKLVEQSRKIHARRGNVDDEEHQSIAKALKQRTNRSERPNFEQETKQVADDYGVDHAQLKEAVTELWHEKTQAAEAREKAKQEIRQSTGYTAGVIRKMENEGLDYTSKDPRFKNFDSLARTMAKEYPDLGIGGGYSSESGDDDTDYAAALWEILKEGKTPPPAKHDRDLLREAAEYVSSGSGTLSADEEAELEKIPFAKRAGVRFGWMKAKYAKLTTAESVARAADETDANPSPEQKEAGNYRKGRCRVLGLPIAIETPAGATRSGADRNGKSWSITMPYHYGYIERIESDADGDNVDVFLGPDLDSEAVFVVDQLDPSGSKFDEHKVMLGFKSEEDAKAGYMAAYSDGWKGLGKITPMTLPAFKAWLDCGDTGEEVADQVSAYAKKHKPAAGQVSLLPESDDDWTAEDEDKHPRDELGQWANGNSGDSPQETGFEKLVNEIGDLKMSAFVQNLKADGVSGEELERMVRDAHGRAIEEHYEAFNPEERASSNGGTLVVGDEDDDLTDDEEEFVLVPVPASTLKKLATANNDKASQKKLLSGLDSIPGQQDLFETDGERT